MMSGPEGFLEDSFKDGLRACLHCGPSVCTVLEEQLHAVVARTCDSRLARGKDASNAMASTFVEQLMMTHASRREDLISMKGQEFKEAASLMVRSARSSSLQMHCIASCT